MTIIKVVDGVYRGSEPLDAYDFRRLKALGIGFVLDLESGMPFDGNPTEESAEVRSMGLKFISLPLGAFWPPLTAELNNAEAYILAHRHQGIYVHCKSGVDRTGMVIGWFRIGQGWSRKDAIAEMKAMGMHWWYYWWPWAL